jgi:hypothetical protein
MSLLQIFEDDVEEEKFVAEVGKLLQFPLTVRVSELYVLHRTGENPFEVMEVIQLAEEKV